MSTSDVATRSRLPSRVALVEDILTPWECGTPGPNIVLTGPQGIGKSVLLEDIIEGVGRTAQVLRWWELTALDEAATPARGLAAMVTDTGSHRPVPSAVEIFQRTRRWLAENTDTRPVLVVVDDVHLVSESYRRVLAELARGEEILLLVAVTSIRLAGRALSQMWRDGLLQDQRVPELEMSDVVELGRDILSGGLEHSTATAVLNASEGIPGHVVAALRKIDTGGWQPPSRGSTRAQRSPVHIPQVKGGQRRILEVLAKVRDLPAAILVDLYGPEDLDALMETGVLRLNGRGISRSVVIANSWVATLVAETTPSDRERELYETVLPFAGDSRLSPGATADLVLWRHDLGLPIDTDRAEALAEEAAEHGDYRTVLALIESTKADSPHLRGLHALALANLGQIDAAMDLARPLLEAGTRFDGRVLDAREVEALYVLAAMSTQMRREPEVLNRLLEIADHHHARLVRPVDSSVARVHTASVAQTRTLNEAVLTARWVMDDFRGDYSPLVDSVSRVSATRRVDRSTRALMVGMTAKASAVCGQPLDGLSKLARAVRIDPNARNAQLARQHTDDAATISRIIAGQWSDLLEQARRKDSDFPHNPRWIRHKLIVGVVLLLSGRPRKALQHLEVAARDSESAREFPVPNLVLTATACAYAWVGQRDSAHVLLRVAENLSVQESYAYRAVGDYFTGLTEVLLGDVAGGVQRWRGWADDTMERGCDSLAMLFLQGLARVGSELAIKDLSVVAARCQGAWAEELTMLAQALQGERITDLRAALRSAVAMGDLGLTGFLERVIAVRGSADGAGPVIPFPDDEIGAPDTGAIDGRAVSMAAVLTVREREIADLAAAGLTNQAIAEEVGLSRRTVEGHMRQVLRKLNMSRRTELVDLWQGATP